jgi:hypothetical protein
MLLMGIWICHHYQANTTTLTYHNLGSQLESLVTALGAKSYFCVFETLNPHGMVPTSTPDIYKVIDNLHMILMGIWICLHAVTTTLVRHDWGGQMESLVTAGHRMIWPCKLCLRL